MMRLNLFLCIFIILLMAFTLHANAATYYIDFNSGNDTNTGTSITSPWKTIPGTRNTSDTAWQSSCWGSPINCTIDVNKKVTPGTVFKFKQGTVHNSSNGGEIDIDSQYYQEASASNPITFEVDTTWGIGDVAFDGTGITAAIALFVIRLDGVEIDGKYAYGFIIRNSEKEGIQFKEHSNGTTTDGAIVQYVKFYNNGASCVSGSECFGGQLHFRHSIGITVSNLEIDGNNNHISGLAFGESNKYARNAIVTNVTVYNHAGDDPPNDSGIGFTAENSQVTFLNCTSYNNLKGWDVGQGGTDGTLDIMYKIINSTAYNNKWGMNLNAAGSGIANYTGNVRFYLINNIIRDNTNYGSEIYCGPYNLYAVHNVYDNNGWLSLTDPQKANLRVYPCGSDSHDINVYFYNNTFYKPSGQYNFTVSRYDSSLTGDPPSNYTIDSDYNAWVPKGTETAFVMWAFFGDDDPGTTYSYSNIGNTSGNWYIWYSYDTSQHDGLGTGHFHADQHSITTEPPFNDVQNHDYTLVSLFKGIDISTKSWFITEMGIDRKGFCRTNWDIGAHEFSGQPCNIPNPPILY